MQLKMENQSNKGKERQLPTNLPAICAKKEVQINKDPSDNWQTLCKREAREVGLFRASPWSSNFFKDPMQSYSKSADPVFYGKPQKK